MVADPSLAPVFIHGLDTLELSNKIVHFNISLIYTLSAIQRITEGFRLDLEEINYHVRQED
jgi:hypothetical protein